MAELPPKLFFRIGEVAGLVGVEPHVLRYWEREFRSIRPTKSAKGQRVYSRKDVESLLRVRDLLYRDGFTIAGAKKKLQRVPGDLSDRGRTRYSTGTAPMPDADVVAASEEALAVVVDRAPLRAVGPPSADPHRPPLRAVGPPLGADGDEDAPQSSPPQVRDKLVALRGEVEAFLAELVANPRR